MEEGIYQLLTQASGVKANISDRLYPLILPDSVVLPAATFQRISTVDDYTLDGPVGLVVARLQIDTWANTLLEAKAAARAIKAVLNGYAGTLPNGVVVSTIQRDGSQDGYDNGPELYYVQTDWKIWFADAD